MIVMTVIYSCRYNSAPIGPIVACISHYSPVWLVQCPWYANKLMDKQTQLTNLLSRAHVRRYLLPCLWIFQFWRGEFIKQEFELMIILLSNLPSFFIHVQCSFSFITVFHPPTAAQPLDVPPGALWLLSPLSAFWRPSIPSVRERCPSGWTSNIQYG